MLTYDYPAGCFARPAWINPSPTEGFYFRQYTSSCFTMQTRQHTAHRWLIGIGDHESSIKSTPPCQHQLKNRDSQ